MRASLLPLAVRLSVAGGREARTRLGIISVAVSLGVALLLTVLACLNGLDTQNARYAWLEPGAGGPDDSTLQSVDPLWWTLHGDMFRGELIGRVDVAATGPTSPIPPGISRLPSAGEYYASPALARLLAHTPVAQLGVRYPGHLVGIIGAAALPGPNSLLIVVGRSVASLSADPDAGEIRRLGTTSPSDCERTCGLGIGTGGDGMTLILSVVAAALLFPVVIFVGGATRLAAARREQRFAAMRLIGATPRQIRLVSTVESTLGAGGGVVLGFALFFLARPLLARIPFTGVPFYPSDLSLTLRDVALVAIGVPVASALAARVALRRVTISPLGVVRRVTPTPPRSWRVIPLVAGIAELAYFAYGTDIGNTHKHSSSEQAYVYLVGILLVMSGLVIAGPWLTMIGARVLARRAQAPSVLIAARRLGDNPQASFRAVSGLVLALFVGATTIGILHTILGGADGGAAAAQSGVPLAQQTGVVIATFDGHPQADPGSSLATVGPALHRISGVTGVIAIRAAANSDPQADDVSYVACGDLVGVPAFGRCPAGAQVVQINPDFGGGVIGHSTMVNTVWPSASMSVADLSQLPIVLLAAGTTGTTAAIEQARSVIEAGFPSPFEPQTLGEIHAASKRQSNNYQRLADVVILGSLPIAGCSLAVSVIGGLAERKRPFSLLRLAGAPLRVLRRIVTLEAAVPLLSAAVFSVGLGLLVAQLFVRAQLQESLAAPPVSFYGYVVGGLLASLVVVVATLPLLARTTGPEVARND